MSDILGYEDDGSADTGPNDVDISRMRPGSLNDDFEIGGPPELQADFRLFLQEYSDIFSYSVKGKAMDVPPMHFQVSKGYGCISLKLPSLCQILLKVRWAIATMLLSVFVPANQP